MSADEEEKWVVIKKNTTTTNKKPFVTLWRLGQWLIVASFITIFAYVIISLVTWSVTLNSIGLMLLRVTFVLSFLAIIRLDFKYFQ